MSKILFSIFTNVCNYFRPALFEGVQCMQQNCALFFLVINFCSSIWTFCKENLLCSFLCKRPYCKTYSSFLLEFAEKKKQNQTKNCDMDWAQRRQVVKKDVSYFGTFLKRWKKSDENLKKSRFKEISPAGLICLILETKINCFNIYTVALNCYNQAFSSLLTF